VAHQANYAVIFISQRTEGDHGYAEAMERIEKLGRSVPGFVALESARAEDGKGITVVFYENAEAIEHWRQNDEHKKVKAEGRRTWYSEYQIYFTKLERGHSWTRED
jgi:heme-degrading monooxygenase HmoA